MSLPVNPFDLATDPDRHPNWQRLLADRRQTLYRFHRQQPAGSVSATWRIVGFFGQLPLE